MTVISWNRTRRVTSLDVLVTAASRRVPLIRAFRAALASSGLRGRVLVTDVNPLSPAVHVADGWHRVPLATDPAYVEDLVALCRRERVALLVPTIDQELEVLSRAVERFASVGTRVAVSPEQTNRICNDKYDTCVYLRARGIPAAESFLPLQLPVEPRFPLFLKPRVGRGGVKAFPVQNPRELEFFLEYVEMPIIQEYLDGPEFTIDMLCGFDGNPLAIVPRERVVIRAGVIDRGRTVHDERLIGLARRVAEVLPCVGAVNVQCRLVGGEPVVFEINPRFSGGIPLTIAAGADFPRLLVDLTAGRPVGAGDRRLPGRPLDDQLRVLASSSTAPRSNRHVSARASPSARWRDSRPVRGRPPGEDGVVTVARQGTAAAGRAHARRSLPGPPAGRSRGAGGARHHDQRGGRRAGRRGLGTRRTHGQGPERGRACQVRDGGRCPGCARGGAGHGR